MNHLEILELIENDEGILKDMYHRFLEEGNH